MCFTFPAPTYLNQDFFFSRSLFVSHLPFLATNSQRIYFLNNKLTSCPTKNPFDPNLLLENQIYNGLRFLLPNLYTNYLIVNVFLKIPSINLVFLILKFPTIVNTSHNHCKNSLVIR